jgi:hypothetical protein
VEAEFIAQLLFDTPTLEQGAESQRDLVKPAHSLSSQLSGVSYQRSATLLEAVQGGVERSLVHLKHFLGHLPDALSDAPAVHGLKSKGFEDQEVQGALDQMGWFAHWHSPQLSTLNPTPALVNNQGEKTKDLVSQKVKNEPVLRQERTPNLTGNTHPSA